MRMSEAQKVQVVARYTAGESMQRLADDSGVTKQAIWALLHGRDVEVRRVGAPSLPIRHEAFDALTPEAAYWIGFLFADGHVGSYGKTPVVVVELSSVDLQHLVKLRTFLGSGHAITPVPAHTIPGRKGKIYTGQRGCRFSVSSERLAGRLIALGRYEDPVSAELAGSRDFWRGFVDGDGSVGRYRSSPRHRYRAGFDLVGEPRMLAAFNDFLSLNNLPRRTVYPRPSICVVQARCGPAQRIVTLLYDNATAALDRKLVIAQEIMGMPMPREYATRAP